MEIRLFKRQDSLLAAFDGQSDEEGTPIRLVVARPISGRDQQVSIMDSKGRKELAWLRSLGELDAASCKLAEEALWLSYRISKIQRVKESYVNHGHRYLKVETDRGERYFNLREPGTNVVRLTDDQMVIRDSMGNRYEIESLLALDEDSRVHLDRVL